MCINPLIPFTCPSRNLIVTHPHPTIFRWESSPKYTFPPSKNSYFENQLQWQVMWKEAPESINHTSLDACTAKAPMKALPSSRDFSKPEFEAFFFFFGSLLSLQKCPVLSQFQHFSLDFPRVFDFPWDLDLPFLELLSFCFPFSLDLPQTTRASLAESEDFLYVSTQKNSHSTWD